VAYEEAVIEIRTLEMSLASAKVIRSAILKEMVENKKSPHAAPPIKLPLIK